MEASPLFRIERKQTLEQRLAEKKKLTAAQELATSSLVIGSRSSAGLVLKDPIAASHHCEIRWQGGRFVLRDVDNVSGTYLNGVRLEGEQVLSPGDRFALGVTTIEWAQDPDQPEPPPGEITLHVREGAFFYAIKKRGEFESDADEWVRSEVTFGRMPALRAVNALGIVAAACVALWLWLAPEGQAALQPGQLSSVHASLFSEHPPTAAHLAPAVALAQELGCAACHESYGQPSQVQCATCHGELVDAAAAARAHPFETGPALECTQCHREHHGAAPEPGTLHPVDIAEDCGECHGSEFDTEAGLIDGLARAVTLFDIAPSTTETLPREPSIGFEAFDHGSHHRVGECAACHEPAASPSAGSGRVGDFVELTFTSCMQCHAEDARPGETLRAEWLPPEELRWDLSWHGAGEDAVNCRACHVEPYAAPLHAVEQVRPVATLFNLASRSHVHLFESPGSNGPGDCATCHKAGPARATGRTLEGRPFRHEQHLSFPRPDSPEQHQLANRQCSECHLDMASSGGLTAAPDVYGGPPIRSCEACHQQDGRPLVTQPGAALETLPALTTPDFPHDLHAEIEGGCFACHSMQASEPGRVETLDGAASCVRCHVRSDEGQTLAHSFLAGAGALGCDTCHVPRGAASPDAAMAAVFYGFDAEASTPSAFSHSLEAHKSAACADCHGELVAGRDIFSPPESAASCRECHAATRFHWR